MTPSIYTKTARKIEATPAADSIKAIASDVLGFREGASASLRVGKSSSSNDLRHSADARHRELLRLLEGALYLAPGIHPAEVLDLARTWASACITGAGEHPRVPANKFLTACIKDL